MAKLTIYLDDKTHTLLTDYANTNNLKMSKAAQALINTALTKDEDTSFSEGGDTGAILERLDEIEKNMLSALDDVTKRMAKATARGTKASLASLIGMVSYLPAIGNLTDSTHHITRKAWESVGFMIRDQRVESDQATLLELKEKSPAEFLKFCWSAGGRASVAGSQVNYSDLTRGLINHSFSNDELADLPEWVIDLQEERAENNRDKEIYERLKYIREFVDKTKDTERLSDSFTKKYYNDLLKERKALEEELKYRKSKTIGALRTSLIPAGDGTYKVAHDE